MKEELDRRASNLQTLAAYFTSHHSQWITTGELERVGGRNAWRTRVSECRTKLKMHVENKQYRDAEGIVHSEYRYLDHTPLGPDASAYRVQKSLW